MNNPKIPKTKRELEQAIKQARMDNQAQMPTLPNRAVIINRHGNGTGDNSQGGALIVPDSYFFLDNTARDDFFIANPDLLVDGVYCVVDGELQRFVGGVWVNHAVVVRGEQGLQGIQGVQGERGERGERGEQGEQGMQGIQGVQGIQGIQGERGEQGEQGMQGVQGIQGERGERGEAAVANINYLGLWSPGTYVRSDCVIAISDGNSYVCTADTTTEEPTTDAVDWALWIQKGSQGERGEQGIQGIQGIQGLPGERGERGEQGIQGEQGLPGEPNPYAIDSERLGGNLPEYYQAAVPAGTSGYLVTHSGTKGQVGNPKNPADFVSMAGVNRANRVVETDASGNIVFADPSAPPTIPPLTNWTNCTVTRDSNVVMSSGTFQAAINRELGLLSVRIEMVPLYHGNASGKTTTIGSNIATIALPSGYGVNIPTGIKRAIIDIDLLSNTAANAGDWAGRIPVDIDLRRVGDTIEVLIYPILPQQFFGVLPYGNVTYGHGSLFGNVLINMLY